jgi:uncharacterized membrane protein
LSPDVEREGDEPPVDPGLGRLLALSDGVFAIALTLLVLGLAVPDGLGTEGEVNDALARQLPNLAGLVLSFVVIGRFWMGHHELFARITRVDPTLRWLNLLYLAPVCITPFSTRVLAVYGDYALPTAIYGLTMAATGLAAWGMGRYARARLDVHVEDRGISLVVVAIFGLSAPLAFLVSPGIAKFSWLLLPVLLPLAGLIRRRRRAT